MLTKSLGDDNLTPDAIGDLKLSEAVDWARMTVDAKGFEYNEDNDYVEASVLEYTKYLLFAYAQSEEQGLDEKANAINYLNLLISGSITENPKNPTATVANMGTSRFTW